ncbi:helix-turn-helix domain-containing protein [Cohnella cellulosilytica]|uniref:Helix-turn-helix domain-containing protein n=1 Tax=Cohnella cellulosilytica TaxID=986710 RepID=A0ABW2F3B4_9BACL
MNTSAAMDSLWFKLRSIEEVQASKWLYPLCYLHSHLLLLNLDGKAHVTVNGSPMRLHRGSAFVGLPGQLVSVHPEGEGTIFVLCFDTIEAGDDGAGSNVNESGDKSPLKGKRILADVKTADELCRRALREWRSGDASGRLLAQAALYELLGFLLKEAEAEAELPLTSDEALNRTLSYMQRYYEQNITIDELADLAGVSRYYYMRLFKSAYGVSAMEYLAELRMNKAKLLMESSGLKLSEIAARVGYNDEFYFIRKFKQQTGIPPATYIRNRQRRIAAYSFPNIGQLLALRIVPYAAPIDHSWTDLYRRKYRTDIVTELSHDFAFNRTALKDAGLDYIIGVDDFVPEEEQRRIGEIAPTLFVPWLADDWRGHLRQVAQFLDIPAEAEACLSKYEHLAAEVRRQVQPAMRGKTVLVVHRIKAGYIVYGRRTVAGVLYDDLGLQPADGVVGLERPRTVTPEELERYPADHILLMLQSGGNEPGDWERLRRSDEWRRIAAGLRGEVTPIAVWPWFDYSAYTQHKFLQTVPSLFQAL